jgi:hypothetical protein
MPREAPLMNTFFPLKFVFGIMSAVSEDLVNKNPSIGSGWNHPISLLSSDSDYLMTDIITEHPSQVTW